MDKLKDQAAAQNNSDQMSETLKKISRQLSLLKSENLQLRRTIETARNPDKNSSNISAYQELQLAELIIENSPAILFRRLAAEDPKDRKMVYVSPNISRFGYEADEFLDGRIMFREILYPKDHKRILIEIKDYMKKNIETYTQIYRILTKGGEIRWVEDRTSVVEDAATGIRYHQGIVIDIHKRKVAEENMRKSEEKYRRIVETTGEGFLLLDKSLAVVDANSAFARMVGSTRSQLIGKQPFAANSEEYQQFWTTQQADSDQEYRKFECEIISTRKQAVPVLIHASALRSDTGEIIGNMAFVSDMTTQKKALTLAGEVQRSLLPGEPPLVKGLDIAGRNIPCDEVGGDYFDYLWDPAVDAGVFSAIVGDITGHGVDSALLMTSARAFLRMRASQPGTISDIVNDMNKHMTDDVYASGRFMTLFYLSIGKKRKSIEWVRAGHDPALLYDPNSDTFHELKGPGLALGVDHEYTYQLQHYYDLQTDQVIVIGTDGIWEGYGKSGEMFGKQRLQNLIRNKASENSETILASIFQEHADFTKGVKTDDDITLVIIKVV